MNGVQRLIFTKMIPVFLKQELIPVPQEGEPVVFKRRKPEEGRITEDMPLDKIYDYIRMLDAEGYREHIWILDHTGWSLSRHRCLQVEKSLEAKVKIHIREE